MIDFAAILPTGKDNAISAEQLRAKIGASNTRQVRALIENARLKGQLICSGKEGYFLPANTEEIKAFIEKSENQVKSILATLKTARKTLKGIDDQAAAFEETELYSYFQEALGDQTKEAQEDQKDAPIQGRTAPPRDALEALRARLNSKKKEGGNKAG